MSVPDILPGALCARLEAVLDPLESLWNPLADLDFGGAGDDGMA